MFPHEMKKFILLSINSLQQGWIQELLKFKLCNFIFFVKDNRPISGVFFACKVCEEVEFFLAAFWLWVLCTLCKINGEGKNLFAV